MFFSRFFPLGRNGIVGKHEAVGMRRGRLKINNPASCSVKADSGTGHRARIASRSALIGVAIKVAEVACARECLGAHYRDDTLRSRARRLRVNRRSTNGTNDGRAVFLTVLGSLSARARKSPCENREPTNRSRINLIGRSFPSEREKNYSPRFTHRVTQIEKLASDRGRTEVGRTDP